MRSNTVLCVAVALLLNLAGSYGQQDVCGQASLNTKIIGGGDATQGFWPWHVGLYSISNELFFCGGTLINKDWVLTSALCARNINEFGSSNVVVYLGRLNRSGPNPHEVNRTVSRVITHPNSSYSTVDNDIALLQLSSSVNFTAYIKPVCLAAAGSEFDQGLLSWVTGWGIIIYSYDLSTVPFSNTLQEAEIPIISNYNCSIAYTNSFSITDNMMCAGLANGGKGSALFDNGGPLVIKQGSRWIQCGIVSSESDGSLPSVFIRVSKYQDWINTQIVNDQPGFITFPNYNNNTPKTTVSVPDTPYILDIPYTPYVPDTLYIPNTPDIPDTPDIDIDIFSGSSPNLHLFPLYFPIFAIISLIFCPYF